MNKIYVFVPLICLLAFGGFYLDFSKKYEAQIQVKKDIAAAEHAAKLKAEAEIRVKAIAETVALQNQRKKEREEKEKREEAEKKAREEAVIRRDLVFHDKQKLDDQIRRLTKEITAEKEAMLKIEEDKKRNVSEKAFLEVYVKKAEANVKSLRDLLDKIAVAEEASVKKSS